LPLRSLPERVGLADATACGLLGSPTTRCRDIVAIVSALAVSNGLADAFTSPQTRVLDLGRHSRSEA